MSPPVPATDSLQRAASTARLDGATITVHVGLRQGYRGPPGEQGEVGERGEPGPVGPSGGRLRRRARGVVEARRVVRSDGAEHLDVADVHTEGHARVVLGVAVASAAGADDEVEVVTAGEVEDETWAWVPEKNIFLGLNGALTQTLEPDFPFILVMGVALTPTKMLVSIRPPLFLSD